MMIMFLLKFQKKQDLLATNRPVLLPIGHLIWADGQILIWMAISIALSRRPAIQKCICSEMMTVILPMFLNKLGLDNTEMAEDYRLSWFDFDLDGDPDLHSRANMYRNDGGCFYKRCSRNGI